MKPGPKPTPTTVQRLRGNPGKRRVNRHEPQMPDVVSADAVPTELAQDPVAARTWSRLAPMLRAAKTMTEVDRDALVALCLQWSQFLQAQESVKRSGMVVRSPIGYPMPNPYITIAHKSLMNCMRLWAEFGITPSARAQLTVGDPPADDPFAEFDEPLPPMPAVRSRGLPS